MRENKQTSDILNLLKTFVEKESLIYPIKEAYLFGSWAYGIPNEESDIDVSIIVDNELTFDEEQSIFDDAQKIHCRLETHVFSKKYFDIARKAIIYDIKEKGIRIA